MFFLEKIDKALNAFRGVVERVEKSTAPLIYFVFIFFFIVQLRNVVENMSASSTINLYFHLHFVLFYLYIFLTILLIAKILTKENIFSVFKVFSIGFSAILIGPIIDIINRGWGSTPMYYIHPDSLKEVVFRFVAFFGEYGDSSGITLGMKVHLSIILMLLFLYVLLKTNKDIKRSFLALFLGYFAIFFSFITPYILSFFIGLDYVYYSGKTVDLFYMAYYIVLIIFLFSVLFYLSDKRFFKAIVKNIRPFRLTYYLLMFFLGVLLGLQYIPRSAIDKVSFADILILIVSITFAWIFSVISNDFADYEIDKVSNKDRPLFQGISKDGYRSVAIASLLISLVSTFVVGYYAFFFISLFIGTYFVYSMPPIRFKRVPVLSKLAISLNSLLLAFLGFSVLKGTEFIDLLKYFPTDYILFFLLITLPANFIDIKDYEGDKKEGIKTLPVLMGLKNSKRLIAFFFSLPYLFIAYKHPSVLILCIAFIIANALIITEEDYSEKSLFVSLLLSIFLITGFIYLPGLWGF